MSDNTGYSLPDPSIFNNPEVEDTEEVEESPKIIAPPRRQMEVITSFSIALQTDGQWVAVVEDYEFIKQRPFHPRDLVPACSLMISEQQAATTAATILQMGQQMEQQIAQQQAAQATVDQLGGEQGIRNGSGLFVANNRQQRRHPSR